MVMVQFQLYFGSCVPSVFVTIQDDLAVLWQSHMYDHTVNVSSTLFDCRVSTFKK